MSVDAYDYPATIPPHENFLATTVIVKHAYKDIWAAYDYSFNNEGMAQKYEISSVPVMAQRR